MIIKAAHGDGSWSIWQADGEVEFLGPHNVIAVEAAEDHDWTTDDRLPHAECYHVRVGPASGREDGEGETVMVRWVRWRGRHDHSDSGDKVTQLLVTRHPVYICNDDGDTIERLR